MKRWTLLIVIALLVLSLACSFGKSSSPTTSSSSGGEATAESSGGNSSQPTAETPSGGGTTAEDNGGGDESDMPTFSETDLEGLNSYRSTLTYRTQIDDGTVEEGTIFVEETRNPLAYHMTITDKGEDGGTMEIVSIGQDQWINIDGEWIYSQVPESELDSFGGALLFDPAEIFAEISTEDYDYVGKETINGIHTKHYRFNLNTADALEMGDLAEVEEGTADIWVANESNLPEIPIKLVILTKGKTEDGATATTTLEMEITDINANFTIEPPAEATTGIGDDIPQYPNATDVALFGTMYSFQTSDDVETVKSFYEEALSNAGWTKSEDSSMEGLVMQTWTKGDRTLSVMISITDDGGSSVILTTEE